MKGNGLERDTLRGVIEGLEAAERRWINTKVNVSYPDLRDAIFYLREFEALDAYLKQSGVYWKEGKIRNE